MDSNRFVPLVNVYFHIYFFGGIFLHSILLYLIRYKSPSSLAHLKYFLYNTSFFQICLLFCAYFTQHRSLSNSTTFAILANGSCKLIGPNICFSFYHIFMGLCLCVALSISNTVVFRYLLLRKSDTGKEHVIFIIILSYIPSIITAIIPFTAEWDFEKVRRHTYLEHPTYNLSIYEPFPGFADITSFQFLSATLILAIGAYGIPLCSMFITRSILKLIKSHSSMSNRTKSQAATLVYGLSCQSIMPFLCYIPIFSCYIYSNVTGEEIIALEHLLMILSCFPAFFDPFISFYFVVPYRNAIVRFVTRKNYTNSMGETTVSAIAVSSVSARSVRIR